MESCPFGLTDPCPGTASGVPGHLFLALVNTLMAAKCQITTKENYPTDTGSLIQDQDEFDFIVVGAGSAGSVVANRLTENPNWKVLVLEAGTYPSMTSEIPSLLFSTQGTPEDWQYSTEPTDQACLGFKDQRCLWPRGKVLGGSSAINAMLYVKGNKRDYDKWASLGNEGWDYDSILKYFKKSEDLQVDELKDTQYSKGGNQPLTLQHSREPLVDLMLDSAETLGYPRASEEKPSGFFENVQTIENGIRANTARSFLGKIKDRQNLLVALNSFVEKLVVEDGVVKGLIVNIAGRKVEVKAKKEYIISAGAVNSPQILMLSGIGPKEHLEDVGIRPIVNLPVGNNLQDHLVFHGFTATMDESVVNKHNIIDEIYRYFMYRQGPISQISATNLLGFINTKNDSTYPNIQIHMIAYPKKEGYLLSEIQRVIGMNEQIKQVELEVNQENPLIVIGPTLLNPKSRGRLRLSSKDPRAKPKIFAGYFEDPDDLEVMLEGVRFAEKLIEAEPFQKVHPNIVDLKIEGCKGHEFRSDEYWKCVLRHLANTIYHPVGTCAMGRRGESVVSHQLKVHGVKNLRVIDASIMPTLPSCNTHAPSLMIGQKGAAMIFEEWEFQHDEL